MTFQHAPEIDLHASGPSRPNVAEIIDQSTINQTPQAITAKLITEIRVFHFDEKYFFLNVRISPAMKEASRIIDSIYMSRESPLSLIARFTRLRTFASERLRIRKPTTRMVINTMGQP